MLLSVLLSADVSLLRNGVTCLDIRTATFIVIRLSMHHGCSTYTDNERPTQSDRNITLLTASCSVVLRIAALAVRILPLTSMPNHTCVEPLAFRVRGIYDSTHSTE